MHSPLSSDDTLQPTALLGMQGLVHGLHQDMSALILDNKILALTCIPSLHSYQL
jgi:hypothetical protein